MFDRRRLALICLALLVAGGAQAATSPWFGVWRLKVEKPDQAPETLVYSDAGGGAMRMVSVEDKSLIVTHFDGKPAADVGAGRSRGWTLAITATSPTSYSWTLSDDSNPRAQGVNTLAADLRTFREVSWAFGKPEKTMTVTYERQTAR